MPSPGGPYDDPDNKVVDWISQTGQFNQKVVEGPDAGLHRGYDPDRCRSFEAGPDYERTQGKRFVKPRPLGEGQHVLITSHA